MRQAQPRLAHEDKRDPRSREGRTGRGVRRAIVGSSERQNPNPESERACEASRVGKSGTGLCHTHRRPRWAGKPQAVCKAAIEPERGAAKPASRARRVAGGARHPVLDWTLPSWRAETPTPRAGPPVLLARRQEQAAGGAPVACGCLQLSRCLAAEGSDRTRAAMHWQEDVGMGTGPHAHAHGSRFTARVQRSSRSSGSD